MHLSHFNQSTTFKYITGLQHAKIHSDMCVKCHFRPACAVRAGYSETTLSVLCNFLSRASLKCHLGLAYMECAGSSERILYADVRMSFFACCKSYRELFTCILGSPNLEPVVDDKINGKSNICNGISIKKEKKK